MSGAPGWLKLSISALSRLAPGPVARLAHSVYRRPAIARRFDKGSRELLRTAAGMLAAGEMRDVATPEGAVRTWRFAATGPLRGRALLLHAWTADARAMAAFIAPLQKQGFDVVALDLPGHGASFSEETDAAAAAKAVLDALPSLGPTPDVAIAHSFGGGVLGMMAHYGWSPRRAVSIASPSRLSAITDDFAAAFALSPACKREFVALVEAKMGIAVDNLDALKIWPEKPTELLILHAPEDAEIDFAEAERMATLPNAELAAFPGLGHREIVYHESSVAAAVSYVVEGSAFLEASPDSSETI